MQYISGIMQRKTLAVALGLFVVGCVVLVWGMLAGTSPAASAAGAGEVAGDTIEAFEGDSALAAEEEDLADQEEAPEATAAPAPEPAIVVYISGAVRMPDVYRLPAGARVKDAVLAAGGLADDADADAINLAARLADAQHVHVPQQGEAPPQADAAAAGEEPAEVGEAGALIDLNQADASDLEALPGIGQAIAERIIAYREANGPFASVDDLRQVKGIGPSLFAQIAPLVRVGH